MDGTEFLDGIPDGHERSIVKEIENMKALKIGTQFSNDTQKDKMRG